MPLGGFEPIIGESFGDIARQRFGWAGLDTSIQQSNVERAMRAEQQQSNWLDQFSRLNQQRQEENLQRQLNADAEARGYALQAAGEATRQRERSEDITRASKQFEAQMKYGSDQLTAQQKIAEEKIAAATKNESLRTEAHGQTLAANYGVAKKNADLAAAALQGLQAAQDKDEADLEATDSKKDAQKFLLLKNRITSRKADIRNAQAAANHTSNALDKLELSATNGGFDIREDGSIVHSDSGKQWTWRNALKEAQDALHGPMGAPPPPGYSFGDRETGRTAPITPPVWPGFTHGTATMPAPAVGPTPSAAPTPPPAIAAPPVPLGPPVPLSTRIANWFGARNTVLPSSGTEPPPLPDVAGSEMTRIQRRMARNDPGYADYPAVGQMGTPGGSMGSDIGPKWWGQQYPPAPQDYRQREVGKVYATPKGPMQWLGNGWVPAT